jgi:hypothetical protein
LVPNLGGGGGITDVPTSQLSDSALQRPIACRPWAVTSKGVSLEMLA